MVLVPPGAAITVAVDDSVFRRSGRRVFGAAWQHDGSSPAKSKLSYGNCFVTAGIVVALPFCSRPVCLPVLARLHVPGRGRAVKPRRQAAPASAVSCAVNLVRLLAGAFPGCPVHVVADAHYHGPALKDLPAGVTWTTRLPRNAVLYAPAPPPGSASPAGPRARDLGWAPPPTWPPPRPGQRPPCISTAGTPPGTWPRSPACGTAAWTPSRSGSSWPATRPPPWPWSPPTWTLPPQRSSSGTQPAGESSRPSPTPATSSPPPRP